MKTSIEKTHEQSSGSFINPFAPDIRSYRLIPYTGKLKELVGDTKLPFTNISIESDSKRREIHLIVSYDELQKCVYINEPAYEKYRTQLDSYFSESSGSIISKYEADDLSKNTSKLSDEKKGNTELNERSSESANKNKDDRTTDLIELKDQALKEYLLSDFGDHKYKRKSIVEIFFLDDEYFKSLKKSGQIREEAITFFEKEGDLIKEAESIPTDGFRRLRFEGIVSSYLRKEAVDTTVTTGTQGKLEKLKQSGYDEKKEDFPKREQNPIPSTN